MGLQVFSRRPILLFWDPQRSNWTSWEKTRRLDSRRVWAARVWLKHRMITFMCLTVPISRIFSLFFDLRGWGFKFSQDVQFLFFETQNYQIGRLEKFPQARFPAGLGSACLIETSYDSFHVSDRPDLSDLLLVFDVRGWGFKISQDVQWLSFRPKTIELDVLRKKNAGSIPGGSGQLVFDWSIFWRPLFISNNLGSFWIPLETIDTTYDLEIISYFSDLGLFPFGNMKFDPTTYALL